MRIRSNLLNNSKKLRKTQTPWEDKLWYNLRAKRFIGYKFRRQFVIGQYIVDFYCHTKRLIIEIDGGQHNERIDLDKDQKRDSNLKKLGYTIVRFWNNDIDENLDGVLEIIYRTLTTSLDRQ